MVAQSIGRAGRKRIENGGIGTAGGRFVFCPPPLDLFSTRPVCLCRRLANKSVGYECPPCCRGCEFAGCRVEGGEREKWAEGQTCFALSRDVGPCRPLALAGMGWDVWLNPPSHPLHLAVLPPFQAPTNQRCHLASGVTLAFTGHFGGVGHWVDPELVGARGGDQSTTGGVVGHFTVFKPLKTHLVGTYVPYPDLSSHLTLGVEVRKSKNGKHRGRASRP